MPSKSGPSRPKAKKATATERVLRIVYDGETYEVPRDQADVPVGTRMALASSTTFTLEGLYQMMGRGQTDDFMMACLIFVARHARGDTVNCLKLIEEFDREKFESGEVLDLSEDDRPEASGANS